MENTYKPTDATVSTLQAWLEQHHFESFTWSVPTNNVVPALLLREDTIHMGHVDISPSNVCDMQLEALISGYSGLLDEATSVLNSPAYKRAVVERKSLWSLLEAWQLTHPEQPFAWLNDDLEGSDSNVPDWVREAGDSIAASLGVSGDNVHIMSMSVVLPPPHMLSLLGEVVEALDIDPTDWDAKDQKAFTRDFARYFEACEFVTVADEKVRLLDELLTALRREKKNRDMRQELGEAQNTIRRMTRETNEGATRHSQELHRVRVESTVAVLRLMNVNSDILRGIVRDNFPEIADELMVALELATAEIFAEVELPVERREPVEA